MKSLVIREANLADCSFILTLIYELACFEKLSHEMTASLPDLEKHLFGPDSKAHVLIAELDGIGTGFALYFFNFSTFLAKPGIHLEDLYVKESYRSKGIGLALLKRLSQIAKDKCFGRLEWAVLDWNQKAIDFYIKIGAIPMNDWTIYRMNESAIAGLAQSNSK